MGVKIAISLPNEEFKLLETLKKKLHLSRSALIQEAISSWLGAIKEKGFARRYELGYRKRPEQISRISNLEKIQFDSLSEEKW